jgi:NTP pyrophosphatase (non-canonical NTP hydrolase)
MNERTFSLIAQEIGAWAKSTFREADLEPSSIHRRLVGEVGEVGRAISEYEAPWSDLDGEFSPENAERIGRFRRFDLLDEIGDVMILAIRLAQAMGADPLQVLDDKWGIVRERVYRYLEPGSGSEDDRWIIRRSTKDHIIRCGEFYIAASPDGFHFTKGKRFAFGFAFEDDARTFISGSRMMDQNGTIIPVRDIPGLEIVEREIRVIEP